MPPDFDIHQRDVANRRRGDDAEMPPHFEFSERERVGYFQLEALVSQSVSQSVTDHRDYYVNSMECRPDRPRYEHAILRQHS